MKSLLRSLLLLPLIAVIAVNGLYFPEIDNDHLDFERQIAATNPPATTQAPAATTTATIDNVKVMTNDVTLVTLYNLIKELEEKVTCQGLEEKVTRLGCPEGFFQLSPSGQCLKFFNDQKRTWFEANTKCQTEGLVSARPSDPVTVQKYIVNTYGKDPSKGWPNVWIPARGSGGNYFIWQPTLYEPTGVQNSAGPRIYYSSPYFKVAPSSSLISPDDCIYMTNYDNDMKKYEEKPYTWATCSGRSHYTLCEFLKE